MAMLIKMATITLVMNLFLYIGINMIASLPDENGIVTRANNDLAFHFKGDIIENIMGQGVMERLSNDTNAGYTTYDVNLEGDIWKEPDKVTGGIGGLTTFIDVINTVWSAVKVLFNIALSPLTLFFSYRMPFLIGLIIGIPYAFMFVLGIIFFIRGMPS